ncbi:MAG: tRNA (adenosine(37)-N6)-threonylcarbamoyltransferase complex ATPase subunit type 1 TsaE [Flavipsychrobacter sp.]|nr:tRNA (adenosine(37)-N6)-threonylcarbamoyltransferase complex ATPase subunit type 1 TsaE [Flavipsychrobacter sp.]
MQISYTLANIESAAHQLWQYANQYRVFAFSGEMGAGKTTFIHALCDMLGVEDAVSSPTFAIINEYYFSVNGGTEQKIYHMDWYRMRDTEEAINAGIEDCVNDPSAYSLVEWPEKARKLLPKKHLWISIIETAPGERLMEVYASEPGLG